MRCRKSISWARKLLVLPFVLGALLQGCAMNRYEAPVGTFHDRAQQTISVLSDFYASRNSYEIDLYLQTVAADSKLKVEETDAQGQPTPLGKPTFTPASINARLDALDLIGIYANRLNDLANTKAPADFQTAATALGGNLKSLDKTFENLGGPKDPTAGKYVGPISTLIGIVGQMFLEHQRDEAIKKAANDGAKSVDAILAQMRDDMDNIFSKEVITGSKERMAVLVHAYNADREKLSYEQRSARLAEIKAASAEAAASVGSAPASLITSMMNAHTKLVQAVNSPQQGKPASLGEFNSALAAWTQLIQTIATQVKLLIH
jgi:hypothetical protein